MEVSVAEMEIVKVLDLENVWLSSRHATPRSAIQAIICSKIEHIVQVNKLTERCRENNDHQQRSQPWRGLSAQSKPHLDNRNELPHGLSSWTWIQIGSSVLVSFPVLYSSFSVTDPRCGLTHFSSAFPK